MIVGENGVGKSMFLKMLGGIYCFDYGEMCWCGEFVSFCFFIEFFCVGIGIIY